MNINLPSDILEISKKYMDMLHPIQRFVGGETLIKTGGGIDQLDIEELAAVVMSIFKFDITEGEITGEFEREMSRFMGQRFGIMCNSGSSANLLAIMALTSPKLGSKALQAGDEIITCGVGFPTTVAPILQAGCIPVFVDVTIPNYNPTPHLVEEAVTERTKAIFIAHTLGNIFDEEEMRDIADRNGLHLIVDCCDAIGGTFGGRPVGSWADISTTSFYPAHHLVVGEGGMVFTNSPMLNSIIRSFRDWGRDCWCLPNCDNTCGKRFGFTGKGELPDGFDHKYTYSHIGYNLKSTDLQASIGLAQLKKLPDFIERRRRNWKLYNKKILDRGLDKYLTLPTHYVRSDPSWFGYALTVKDTAPFSREELTDFLNERKVMTRPLFAGNITRQPAFLGKGVISEGLPKADIVMKRTFWVGVHPILTEEMIDYVVKSLEEFVKKYEKVEG